MNLTVIVPLRASLGVSLYKIHSWVGFHEFNENTNLHSYLWTSTTHLWLLLSNTYLNHMVYLNTHHGAKIYRDLDYFPSLVLALKSKVRKRILINRDERQVRLSHLYMLYSLKLYCWRTSYSLITFVSSSPFQLCLATLTRSFQSPCLLHYFSIIHRVQLLLPTHKFSLSSVLFTAKNVLR